MAVIIFHILSLLFGATAADPCKVYGIAYIEESRAKADYIVYEEDSEAFADLIVFEEENSLYADKEGIWHFTEDRGFADFTVYFTTKKRDAHFSVAYTETESFAGCND